MLLGTGVVAIACGSDSKNPASSSGTDSSTSGNQPNSPGSSGNGDTANPSNNPSGGEAPAGGEQNPATSGNEGQPGNIPVQQNPDNPGSTDNPNPDQMNPPTNPGTPVTANCNPPEGAVPNLALQQVATGLTRPIYVTQAPGDDSRLFIMLKGGTIRVVQDGQLQPTPFIDVSSMLNDDGDREQGLLGMAFHPDFATNGLFYLHFSSNGGQGMGASGDTVVAEFKANADHTAGEPASRRILLTTAGLEANHNGGQLAFGPDKMLYFGLGDGGGGDDQHGNPGNGQSLNVLNAKILRLDPAGREVNNSYGIPAGNLAAVTGQQALPEIWAYGL
ncbi:MAG TPA: PQQ-dependent sugar dehydrogenase, partial [Polyangiaceae bacterium]|nr:PQQ-dependent sugar dehydrogenase [Polyangiaceae bacterium]